MGGGSSVLIKLRLSLALGGSGFTETTVADPWAEWLTAAGTVGTTKRDPMFLKRHTVDAGSSVPRGQRGARTSCGWHIASLRFCGSRFGLSRWTARAAVGRRSP